MKRKLGRTGLEVAPIGFGGIPIQRLEQEAIDKLFDAIVDSPINFIDTARGYTTSEETIGRALTKISRERGIDVRSRFVIATKTMVRDYEGMKREIETSLANLQTDYIDLYQCHLLRDRATYDLLMSEQGGVRAMREAQEAGKIRHIGVTAHSADMLLSILDEMPFETIQFPYNIVETQAEELFRRAHALGKGIIVMKPLAGGALTAYTEDGTLPLQFVLANPLISVAIPGMETPEQVAQNLAAASKPLTAADAARCEEIRRAMGDKFCRRCGYCAPCTVGIDIPSQFLFEGYLTRYGLGGWASSRYMAQAIRADACIACGACEPRCPYDLPIIEMLRNVRDRFEAIATAQD